MRQGRPHHISYFQTNFTHTTYFQVNSFPSLAISQIYFPPHSSCFTINFSHIRRSPFYHFCFLSFPRGCFTHTHLSLYFNSAVFVSHSFSITQFASTHISIDFLLILKLYIFNHLLYHFNIQTNSSIHRSPTCVEFSLPLNHLLQTPNNNASSPIVIFSSQ